MPRIPTAKERSIGSPTGGMRQQSTRMPDTGGDLTAKAVAKFGKQVEDAAYAFHAAEVKTETIEAETQMRKAFAETQIGLESEGDYRKVMPHYQASAKKIRKELINNRKASPDALDKINQMYERMNAENEVKAMRRQRQRFVHEADGKYKTALQEAEIAGDLEKAESILTTAVDTGVWNAGAAAERRISIKRNIDWYDAKDAIEEYPDQGMDALNAGQWKNLTREDKDRLESVATAVKRNMEKVRKEQLTEDKIEHEATLMTGIDTAGKPAELHAVIDEALKSGAFDKKDAATWRRKVNEGWADTTSAAVQRKLNNIEIQMAINPDTDPAEFRRQAMDIIQHEQLTSQSTTDVLSMLHKLESKQKQKQTDAQKHKNDVKRVAMKRIDELAKMNFFGNRVFDKNGRDITEESQREALADRLEEAEDVSLWPGYGGSEDDKREAREAARRETIREQEENDALYNRTIKTINRYIENHPDTTEKEIIDMINDLPEIVNRWEKEAFDEITKVD